MKSEERTNTQKIGSSSVQVSFHCSGLKINRKAYYSSSLFLLFFVLSPPFQAFLFEILSFFFLISLHHSHGEDFCFWYYYYYYYYSLSPKIFPEVHDYFFIDSPRWPLYDVRVVLTLTYFSRSQVRSKSKFSKFQITISQKLSKV